MYAITLWEPWASLVAIGAKRFETRSWPPPAKLRGERIAIHAAKQWTGEQRKTAERFATLPGQEKLLWPLVEDWRYQRVRWQPPTLGRVLCTVQLADWWTIRWGDWTLERNEQVGFRPGTRSNEWAFGDYSYGRFVWQLTDREVITPIAASGAQKFWPWTG